MRPPLEEDSLRWPGGPEEDSGIHASHWRGRLNETIEEEKAEEEEEEEEKEEEEEEEEEDRRTVTPLNLTSVSDHNIYILSKTLIKKHIAFVNC